jgi:hypothetical protein
MSPGTLPVCDAPQRLQNWASSALGEPQFVQNIQLHRDMGV